MSGFQRRPEDYMSHSATSGTLMRYGAIILISSAVLLVLEIAAGRLIAPYVGVSLYSWTAIGEIAPQPVAQRQTRQDDANDRSP